MQPLDSGTDTNGKTLVEISDADPDWLTNETLKALYQHNRPPKIYTQGHLIVEIIADKKDNHEIKKLSKSDLLRHIHNAVRFTKFAKICNVPSYVVPHILATPASLLDFPELSGIVACPVMRPDGSIIGSAGYDSNTGLEYIESLFLTVPPVPLYPTPDEAHKAMLRLMYYVREFPFVDQAGKANALGALITPIVRPLINSSIPIILFSAYRPESGKSTLSDLISILATGRYGGYMGAPSRREEWSKLITSTLRGATSVVVIDNVDSKQPLDSPDLSRLITDREWAERELGYSRRIRIPNQALLLATGNNIKVGGDVGSRSVVVNLDAGPDPSSRKLSTSSPQLFWLEERGAMLSAVLTAARAWIVAGSPRPQKTPNTRFPEWVRVVGGILEYCGVSGFLENLEEARATADQETAEWERFFHAVSRHFAEPFQTRHLIAKIQLELDLKDTLPLSVRALAGRPDALATALGREFSSRSGRHYGKSGIRIVVLGAGHAGALKYQIVTSEEAGAV